MEIGGGKFVLVGGGGLIGSHTADLLLREGAGEVVIFEPQGGGGGNLLEASGDPRLRLAASADVLRRESLAEAFEGADGVFHFAAMWLLHCEEQPRRAIDLNVGGTVNVLEACLAQGVKRLVFSSSAAVYGPTEAIPVREDQPLRAATVYGATKIAAEAILRAYHFRSGLTFAGLRYFNVYGPRQAWQGPYVSVVMKMLNAIESGQGPTIVGDGAESLDMIAVEDCARANLCGMQAQAPQGFYNVATGRGTTLRELAQSLLDLTGSSLAIRHAPGTASSGRGLVGSTELAEQEIGFRASIGLREGLKRLIDWRAAEKTGA